MRASALVIVALLAVGCGSSSSTGPTPVQTLPPITIDCSIVGTLPCQTPPPASPTPTPTPTGSFTVSGSVSDATSGGLLPGITVVASSGSTVSTDNLGHYAIAGVKAGPVSLTFSATSYTTQSKTITVAANATVDVVLQRSSIGLPPPTGLPPTTGPITITGLTIPTVQLNSLTVMTFSLTGNATTFVWSFGDGTSLTTRNSGRISHAYSAAGSYTVTLTASNDDTSVTSTSTAVVTPLPPSITVTLNCTINASTVSSPCNVSAVDQTGANVTANITQVVYDWGDGHVDTVASPLGSHTYPQPGVFIIKATVTANGITGSASKTATVS